MTSATFIESLRALRFDNTFNPYVDVCPDHDMPDAPRVRCNNLRIVLDAALSQGVESVWIGRDLGYRGGRRTGLALTDEVHLPSHAGLYRAADLARATRGPLAGERTAGVIWRVLNVVDRPVFLWNVVPLHPHDVDNPFSNRRHIRAEREASLPLLACLLEALRPRRVFAIGRDAHDALRTMSIDATPVRHPSYGGQREFVEAMCHHYSITGGTVASGSGSLFDQLGSREADR